jgi:hypothetical protein
LHVTACLSGINHTGSGSWYSRVGEPTQMRVYGPNGLALAVARSRLPRMTRPAVPMQPGRYARTRRSMRSLPSRAWKTECRKRAVAKGRNALDVLDALKLGVLDGSVDQSMLSRLKVASEGLTDTSGDPDSTLCGRDRPARCRGTRESGRALGQSIRSGQSVGCLKSLNCHQKH